MMVRMLAELALAKTLLGLTSAALAQELAAPSDYSPTEAAAIRTIRIEKDGSYQQVVVAVANRSKEPFNANFSCSLLDKAGNLVDETSGSAQAVPPGQEIVAKSMSFRSKIDKAACRIQFTIAAD